MRIRLVEEYTTTTDRTWYRIERLVFPFGWSYEEGSHDLILAREFFERLKKSKGLLKVRRILAKATV